MLSKRIHTCFFMMALAVAVVFSTSCGNHADSAAPVKHFAEMRTATGRIFLDPFPAERVLSAGGSSATGTFYAYKIGFETAQEPDSKSKAEWERYVDYSMNKDWVLVNGEDSLPVVFNQPVVKRSPKITESILVFEVPKGVSPLQMVYRDEFNHGEDRTFLLKSKTE